MPAVVYVVSTLLLRVATSVAAEEIPLHAPIPDDVQEIEITYSEANRPVVAFNSNPQRSSRPRLRPPHASFDLLSVLADPVAGSACRREASTGPGLTINVPSSTGPAACVIPFKQHALLDLLSYDTLLIEGRASGSVTLTFSGEGPDPSRPLTELVPLSGTFDLEQPLRRVFSGLDPRHIGHLVLLSDGQPAQVQIATLTVDQRSSRKPHRSSRGIWVWEYRDVLANPERILLDCRRFAVSRVLLQLPDLRDGEDVWEAYGRFVVHAAAAGLEAIALDGDPRAIYDPGPLIEKVQRLVSLLPLDRPVSIQLDIEPYLLPEFSPPTDYRRYIEALDRVKQALNDRGRLSVVMPFWLTEKFLDGRPVAFTVMDRVDEVAVMSYRTDMDEVRAIADDWLRYGDLAAKPVWLALETRPLPVERRLTLIREPREKFVEAYLDRPGHRLILNPADARGPRPGWEGFRVAHRITVRPERLTFAGRQRREVEAALAVLDRLPFASSAGILIHDYTGWLSLAP